MVTLPSKEQEILSEMFAALRNNSFLCHNTQSFHQALLIKAYEAEEKSFPNNVKCVSRSYVPKTANIIGSRCIR